RSQRWLTDALPPAIAALVFAVLAGVFLLHHRRRWTYGVMVGFTVTSLVSTPVLEAIRVGQVFTGNNVAAAEPLKQTVASLLPYPTNTLGATDTVMPAGTALPGLQMACGEGDATTDSDGDGLSDADEACLGTDPYRSDTSGSGLPDGLK